MFLLHVSRFQGRVSVTNFRVWAKAIVIDSVVKYLFLQWHVLVFRIMV